MQRSKPLTLRRNFSWTFIGNAVYAACQWGMLVVIAKLGSPEMVGQFTLGLAVTAPVFMFTNLQLRGVQATDASRQYLFGDYLSLRLISTALALGVIAVIALASGYRREITLIILLVGFAKAFESISDVFYGLIQQHERMDFISISMMIKGTLSLLILGSGIYFTHSIFWGILGLAVAWALVLVGYDIPSSRLILKTYPSLQYQESRETHRRPIIKPCWHFKTLKKLVLLAMPLGFVMLLTSLYPNIPRYYIEGYLGERELGIFAALSYLMVAGRLIISALGQSAMPRLAKYYAAGDVNSFRTLMLKLITLSLLPAILGVLVSSIAGREILSLIYQPEYAEYNDVFVWLMVAAGISYIEAFLSYGITAARYFRIQIPLFSLVTGSTFLACTFLIPTQGLNGAAIALIIGALIRTICTLVVMIHVLFKLKSYSMDKQISSNFHS